MDVLPDAVVQYILSNMTNARDVATCACVSKQWKESMPFIRSLYFARNSFGDESTDVDAIIGQLIMSAVCLEELIIYCPFSTTSLTSWLLISSRSLRHLELRMDNPMQKKVLPGSITELDCIGWAKGLQTLKLWGVLITHSPNWGEFQSLRTLEIVGATLKDRALSDTIRACPNLTNLSLLGCNGLISVTINLQQLEQCRLDFCGWDVCSLSISSPKLQLLDIQGCSWIHVDKNHCLKNVSIANNEGKVCKVDLGKLPGLEFLSIRGVQWCWNAVSSILQCSSEVRHLVMKIEFTGDSNHLQAFPEIDLVEFFNNHPKLQNFEIHGAMFAALCQKNSLRSLDSRFTIPCLEETVITVRSPLNAEQKMSTIETLVKCSQRLRRMVIRVSQMKSCHSSADDFFEDICRFGHMNHKVIQIE
ncbi:F-box protein At1g10780-like [Magnolia sinica]|uniref:F-box protein At1g10780-like n=1 Tax=Magnolia sinica TaxID=86752 RepID=UPI0026591C86|nr:F-box protein At1g10780-like [Magnolia sinica]XP_058097188.1 F-box protein At1g10780-like [Magnolia sinica]XP_058097189.1 F-box protein At1g10780-like [Magnolia sinica]XP_058097190.1 F-box protein At1g10780-like [Magnolia sinica]